MLLVYVRTVILYLFLILAVRIMGKRQIGEMEPAEFVVTMLVANLAAIPMQDGGIPLFSGLIPIFTVLGVELMLSYLSLNSVGFRKVLCGKPVILIDNGRVLQSELRRTRISQDELYCQLRGAGVLNIRTVQFAVLETNGKVSVFPYPKDSPATAKDAGVKASEQYLPVTLISDGKVMRENLAGAGKDEAWISGELKKRNTTVEDTWLFSVEKDGAVMWLPREEAQ